MSIHSPVSTSKPPVTKLVSTYFPALTGLRALAAYLVFFTHFNPFALGSIGWKIVHQGNMGVTIFFVLSGFLICTRYLNKLEFSGRWLQKYVQNRVARIYPMYFLITSLTFLLIATGVVEDLTGQWDNYVSYEKQLVLFLNFTLLRAFFQNILFTGVPQGWTLTVEECFYLIAPILLLGLAHLRKDSHRYALLVVYVVILLLGGIFAWKVIPKFMGFFGTAPFMLTYTFPGRCIEFLSGIGLALFLRSKQNRGKGTYCTWTGLGWIGACILAMAYVNPVTGGLNSISDAGIAINNFVLPGGIVLLLYGLIYEDTWLQRLLHTRLFDTLGKSSYVFYLIHMGIVSTLLDTYVTDNIWLHFVLLNGLSILLFHLVEDPLQKLIRAR